LASKYIELTKNLPFVSSHKISEQILNSGEALQKFKTMIKDQGGALDLFNDVFISNLTKNKILIKSSREGFVSKFDLEKLGNITRDYCSFGSLGIKVLVNIGDLVHKGDTIIELYGKESKLDFKSCIRLSKNKKISNKLIINVI
jgi:pyrimidine-nucleoside phosphorylase